MMVKILTGDCRDVLKTLAPQSVHMVCTSPPYFGLRDYGTTEWSGGDPDHEHDRVGARNGRGGSGTPGKQTTGAFPSTVPVNKCSCGAVRVDRQIGLEETPAAYVAEMVGVFREVWRVLRDDGTCWLNLGDSYANDGKWGGSTGGKHVTSVHGNTGIGRAKKTTGMKPKDLMMIPARVAIALQDDGWYLRSNVIWSKPNPMPESCNDRPTTAHEHVFLLTKSGDSLFWTHRDGAGARKQPEPDYRWVHRATKEERATAPVGWPDVGKKEWRRINLWSAHDYFYDAEAIKEPGTVPAGTKGAKGSAARFGMEGVNSRPPEYKVYDGTRNARSVWTIATQPFSEAHFACVDDQTECLTAEGWKRQEDIRPGMIAAQFDVGSQRLSWAPIEEVARYSVTNQEMVVGSCRDMDMWLTPNHRTVIHKRHPRTRKILPPVVIRADQLLASHSVPTAADWSYDGDASIPIEWAELFGWYAAEGHESKDSLSVELYQSESANSAKCRHIEDLLRQVGAEWTRASCKRTWRGRPADMTAYRISGYAAVRLREIGPGKKIPFGSVLWSDDRILALLEGLIGGDGHVRLSDGRRCFIQKDLQQCGLVQALAIRIGLSAMVSVRRDGIGVVWLTKHKTRSFRGTNGLGSAPVRLPYTGIVWCPKLPNGTWMARRDGKPFITGNTFPPKLAETCIMAGTSERGCCPACGASWARKTGKIDTGRTQKMADGWDTGEGSHGTVHRGGREKGEAGVPVMATVTVGWQPTCDCPPADPVPCVVLDPFGGAGTVGMVADRLQQDAILIELNPEYVTIMRKRIEGDAGMFAQVAAE